MTLNLIQNIGICLAALGVSVDSQGVISTQPTPCNHPRSVVDYANLVSTGTWTEKTVKGAVNVSAKIWTRAIQTALDENKTVFIPNQTRPYYIDKPLVIRSGQHLIVDPNTEIRLKPGTSTCMICNEHSILGQNNPVQLDNPDVDITIEGGIWTTLAVDHNESNGNFTGGPDPTNELHGHGAILMNNAKRIRIRNVTIKECLPHGIQMSNVSEFLVENIRFDNHMRDGVHINGPASNGIIRNIRGVTWDDMVALNAWDWKNTCMSFGPIDHILVEDVHAGSPDSDYRAHIRLLGGTKHYANGKRVDCNIENIVIRDISGVQTFKMYDQPNLELGPENDFADPIGNFKNLSFSNIVVIDPPEHPFPIASNIDGITIDNVTLSFNKRANFTKLVHLGPMSATYKPDQNNPASWVEIFSPNKDCTVRNLKVMNIQKREIIDGKTITSPIKPEECIDVVTQKLNPDYPQTTPKGGTGKGILITGK